MYVIIDTNILRADFLFNSVNYKLFSEFLQKTRATLILPKVVVAEASYLYDAELELKKRTLKKALMDLSHFCSPKIDIDNWQKIMSKDLNHSYESFLNDAFCYLEILNYQTISLSELIKRGIHRIRPYSNKGEEFRDCVIWLSILEFLKKRQDEKCVFISNDLKAFADDNRKDLHPTLQNDLTINDLQLSFCTSIEDFIKDYASRVIWFTKEWVIDHIDWDEINKQVTEAVETIHCGYFFTLYERTINAKWDYYYEVKNVEINKEWLEYYFYEKDEETFSLELHFYGTTDIDFFLSNDKVETISTGFATQTMAICTKDKIFEYSGEYYEEESGLVLPDCKD